MFGRDEGLKAGTSSEFFSGRRKRRRFFSVTIPLFIFACGLAFGAVWLVLKTPFFRAQAVEISGEAQVSEDEVRAVLSAISGKSLLRRFFGAENMLLWPDYVRADELALLPAVKLLEIDKDYDNKIVRVGVVEREPYGIWCAARAGECFWFDGEGVIFKPGFAAEGNLIRAVRDYSRDAVRPGEIILPREFLPGIFSIFKALEEAEVSVKEVRIEDLGLAEAEVLTHGPRLYFSLRFPTEGAADVINSLRNNGVYKTLEYVDFRVENRAYYK